MNQFRRFVCPETIRLATVAAALLVLTACSATRSTQPLGETTRATFYREGVPGGVIVETTRLDATIAGIDATNRAVTVAVPDGREKVIGCGPEVVNFNQLRVGDRINTTITSELVLALAGADVPEISISAAEAALSPKGTKPAGALTALQEYTATLTAINQRRREVTLRLPDETKRTFTVRPDIDLSQRKVGTQVAVRVSVAVAIEVIGR